MKIFEVVDKRETAGLKTYLAKVRLQQQGYKQIVDVSVVATSQNMAIKQLRSIYGSTSLIGNPREIGKNRR